MTLNEIADFIQFLIDCKTISGDCERYPEFLRDYQAKVQRLEEMLVRCADWLERVDWEYPEDGPNNDDLNFMRDPS